MRLVKCNKNHIYDRDKFMNCPHCSGIGVEALTGTMRGADQGEVETDIPEMSQQGFYEKVGRRDTVGMVVCTKGNMAGEGFFLKTGENVIGRASNMDVALVRETSISRKRHAVIWYEEENRQFYLETAADKSEVFCNQKMVIGRILLKDRDEIEIGECHLVFIHAGDIW